MSPVSALARRPLPGFFGVTPQDALTARDFARMRGVVGTLRIPIFWFACEPSRGEFDFGNLDTTIGRAADAGIDVLPFVYGSPSWVAEDSALPPLDSASDRHAWAGFLKTLIRRYGPDGSFWRGRLLRRPIRRWQVWNEPNFPLFWLPRPSARGYARLLTLTARAIRSEDRRARIVMAGLAPVEDGPLPWEFLRNLYEVPRIKHSFDAVGLHPYSASLDSLEIPSRVGASHDGGKPATGSRTLDVTEFGGLGWITAEPDGQDPEGASHLPSSLVSVPPRQPAAPASIGCRLVYVARWVRTGSPLRVLRARWPFRH